MTHLQDIYKAISKRLQDILNKKNLSEEDLDLTHEPLTILRLDIEQIIHLVAQENNISYDQLQQVESVNYKQAADDICETLWSPKKKD